MNKGEGGHTIEGMFKSDNKGNQITGLISSLPSRYHFLGMPVNQAHSSGHIITWVVDMYAIDPNGSQWYVNGILIKERPEHRGNILEMFEENALYHTDWSDNRNLRGKIITFLVVSVIHEPCYAKYRAYTMAPTHVLATIAWVMGERESAK